MINMGTTVFGLIETSALTSMGLGYFIEYLTIINDDNTMSFDVVKGGNWATMLNARPLSKWKQDLSSPLKFRYNSFGFEDYKNQHYLQISCNIRLCLLSDENCRPATCHEDVNGVKYKCPK